MNIHNSTLIGKSLASRMPPELKREFQAYLIASVSLYDTRNSPVPEDIREMAEWAGEAYTTFIHKAEELHKS